MSRLEKVDHYIYIPRKGEDVKKIISSGSENCNGYYKHGNNYYIGYMERVDSLRNLEPGSVESFLQDFKKYYDKIFNENDTYEFWIHFGQVRNEESLDYSWLETSINKMRSEKLKSRVYFLPVSINGGYPADLCTEEGKLIFPGNTPLNIPANPAPSPLPEEKPVCSPGSCNNPNKAVSAFLWLMEHICLSLIAIVLLLWTLVPPLILFVPNTIDFNAKTIMIPLPFFYANKDKTSDLTNLNGNTENVSSTYVIKCKNDFIPYFCLTFCFFAYALNLILVFILIRNLFRHYSRKKRICRQHEFYGNLESVICEVERTINLNGFPEESKYDVIKHANQLRERFVQAAIRLYFDGDDGE